MKKPNLKNRIIALIMAGVMATSTVIFGFISWINKKTEKTDIINNPSVTDTYEGHEEATEIYSYLGISKDLNDMSNTYGVSEKTVEKYEDKDMTLKSADELKKELDTLFELLESKNDLTEQKEEVIERIARLMIQEKYVNEYLYNSYSTVHSILENSLRAYVGEKYGITDTENIGFSYFNSANIHYNDNIHSPLFGKEISGIEALARTTSSNDKNLDDNDKYNKDRNGILNSSLALAEKLNEEVENKDLYRKSLAKKLR